MFAHAQTFAHHQNILAARSPYFAKMLSPKIQTDPLKHEIAGCDPCKFEQLLFFMYTGSLQAPADNKDLLLTAREYGIVTLQNICERPLKFEPTIEDDMLFMSILLQ